MKKKAGRDRFRALDGLVFRLGLPRTVWPSGAGTFRRKPPPEPESSHRTATPRKRGSRKNSRKRRRDAEQGRCQVCEEFRPGQKVRRINIGGRPYACETCTELIADNILSGEALE
jgi:hypothetical protein